VTAARRMVLVLAAALLLGSSTRTDLARADAAYGQRGRADSAGRLEAGPIRAAVRGYEAALAADPEDLESRWKLLRALYFEGDFATTEPAAKQALFERATALADESWARVEARVGRDLVELPESELRARLAQSDTAADDVAALSFWGAVSWGAWSQTHGLLDAVRRGVAERIHGLALIASRLDPGLEQGGPLRLLSRLHAKLPRVPLVSGFVDRSQAAPLAEEALRRWPEHPGNRLLLALTWLELEPARRDEALALLRQVAEITPRSSQLAEDAAVVHAARERLAQERDPQPLASGG